MRRPGKAGRDGATPARAAAKRLLQHRIPCQAPGSVTPMQAGMPQHRPAEGPTGLGSGWRSIRRSHVNGTCCCLPLPASLQHAVLLGCPVEERVLDLQQEGALREEGSQYSRQRRAHISGASGSAGPAAGSPHIRDASATQRAARSGALPCASPEQRRTAMPRGVRPMASPLQPFPPTPPAPAPHVPGLRTGRCRGPSETWLPAQRGRGWRRRRSRRRPTRNEGAEAAACAARLPAPCTLPFVARSLAGVQIWLHRSP